MTDWTICGRGDGCPAARFANGPACLSHLTKYEFEDTLSRLVPGSDLDLRGVVIKDGYSRLQEIFEHISAINNGSVRIGSARFDRATFNGTATFDGVTILGHSDFNATRFNASASFLKTTFEGGADFSTAEFGGAVTFADAEFGEPTVGFGECASFNGAHFGVATFANARFCGNASFEGISVATELTLGPTRISGKLLLNGLQAAGPVDIQAEVPKVSCKGADFAGQARLRLAGSRLWLTNSVFEQPATVESWPQIVTGEHGTQVDDPSVKVRSLRGVDAEHLSLSDADLSRCLVYGLRRPELLRLAGRCSFAPTPRGWHLRWGWLPLRWTNREALYEEHLWRREDEPTTRGWDEADPDPDPDDDKPAPLRPARLAVLYRQLRQAVEDARNEPGAADLYYGEMEMRRLSTERRDERWLLTVYWLVSGYGLRASRAMLVLAALVALAALAFQRAGFPGHTHGYLDCLLYASGSVLSLDLTGHLPMLLTDWGQLARMLLRIGGPVLLGLGALAVRGRIKR